MLASVGRQHTKFEFGTHKRGPERWRRKELLPITERQSVTRPVTRSTADIVRDATLPVSAADDDIEWNERPG